MRASIVFLASASLAFASTGMTIGNVASAPVRLVSTTHGIKDALLSAKFENKSAKTISGYRVGWASIVHEKANFKIGEWMNVPSGIEPGSVQIVPSQNIKLNLQAQEMMFFISEVRFADGSHWKAKYSQVTKPE